MLKSSHLLTLTLFFFILNICTFAQINGARSKPSGEVASVADNESAPLQLELTKNGRYIKVINRTETAIVKFRFGCLHTENDSQRITKSFTPKILKLSEVVIEPKDMFSFGTELGGIEKCNSELGSLVVTMVFFEDKRRWKLEDHLENPD